MSPRRLQQQMRDFDVTLTPHIFRLALRTSKIILQARTSCLSYFFHSSPIVQKCLNKLYVKRQGLIKSLGAIRAIHIQTLSLKKSWISCCISWVCSQREVNVWCFLMVIHIRRHTTVEKNCDKRVVSGLHSNLAYNLLFLPVCNLQQNVASKDTESLKHSPDFIYACINKTSHCVPAIDVTH